jgi:hypothetical protein
MGAIALSSIRLSYGERQYKAEDFTRNRWTFSQSIADVAMEEWRGVPDSLE